MSLDTGGMMQRVDLDSLLSSVCTDIVDASQQVTLWSNALQFSPFSALQRCLANLITTR
jgi:hypothetical protein